MKKKLSEDEKEAIWAWERSYLRMRNKLSGVHIAFSLCSVRQDVGCCNRNLLNCRSKISKRYKPIWVIIIFVRVLVGPCIVFDPFIKRSHHTPCAWPFFVFWRQKLKPTKIETPMVWIKPQTPCHILKFFHIKDMYTTFLDKGRHGYSGWAWLIATSLESHPWRHPIVVSYWRSHVGRLPRSHSRYKDRYQ